MVTCNLIKKRAFANFGQLCIVFTVFMVPGVISSPTTQNKTPRIFVVYAND